MTQKRIGVAVVAPDSKAALTTIENLEQRGIPAVWMTSGSAGGGDSLSVLAVAASRTQHIMLGTAITQTFPRHPVAVAQQALVLAQLASGRFRLGLGTSGRAGMEQTFGVDFRAPLAHLREYIRIEKALLQQGSVDFSGRYYQAHTSIPSPVDVPVMVAALGARAYELWGAEAYGAISWVCPGAYLRDVALPAMRRGAERAGRPVPPLVAQVPVCVHDNPEEAREAVRQQFAGFARSPFYQNMFIAAGFPEVSQGTWSDRMVDAVAVWGDESRVAEGLRELLSLGATEILASPVPAGGDRAASLERNLGHLARLAQSVTE
jgi:F420-dependent oxidoreductase-like protein